MIVNLQMVGAFKEKYRVLWKEKLDLDLGFQGRPVKGTDTYID